jgi:ferrochelatase
MQLENLGCDEIRVIPMFPQFSYATTGSIARFLDEHLSSETRGKLSWIKSYPAHPAYVGVMQTMIREFLDVNQLSEEKTLLFFSAHGLPQVYIDEGDVYEKECQASFEKIRTAFPRAFHLLAYQSKFGRGEWLKPSTQEMCEQLDKPDNIVIIPLSFTSDHIETLFEIEYLYLPILQKKGISAYRLPALNRRSDWIDALIQIIQDPSSVSTQMLIKH